MHRTQIHLTPEQIEAFGAELDALERRTRAQVGEEDALYIRRVMKLRQNLELAGRGLLMVSLFPPAWLSGTALLGLAKILDNMEVGHNVMHGQYDFMRDPVLNTQYEWDTVAPGDQWRHGHNFVHHTFTNVLGLDHDVGYRVARLSEHQPWHPKWLLNLPNTFLLATFFDWGVGLHDTNLADAFLELNPRQADWGKVRVLARKGARMALKDFVLFPVLAGPMAGAVLLGNVVANLMRNYWAWAVIYCGHFPDGTALFSEADIASETRGQWYLRQVLGSANIEGGRIMHLMTGHLSHQIEHHLFPALPAWRYPALAEEVQAICRKYGVPYNSGSFGRQVTNVIARIARLSLPSSMDDLKRFRANARVMGRLKAKGQEVLRGERKPSAASPPAPATGRPRTKLTQLQAVGA